MYNKITQLKFIETHIAKVLSTISCLLLVGFCFGQTTVVNFENSADYTMGSWGGGASIELTNPDQSGLNTSATIAKYTKGSGTWNQGVAVMINTPQSYSDLASVQLLVKAPNTTNSYVKLEKDGVGDIAEGWFTPTSTSDWQLVTINFNYTGTGDVNTATYDKFVLFFNVNTDANGEEWLFDDIALNSNPLSVDEKINTEFKIYPNPVKDVLTFKTSNVLDGSKVSVYNVAGQLIKTSNSVSLNVEDLKSGLYIATIENKLGQKITKKFIKN